MGKWQFISGTVAFFTGICINGFIAELRYERGLGTIIDIEGVEADVMNSAFSIMIGFVF